MPSSRKSARMGIRIDADLKAWAEEYAETRRTNLTQLITDQLVKLREQNLRRGHGRQAS